MNYGNSHVAKKNINNLIKKKSNKQYKKCSKEHTNHSDVTYNYYTTYFHIIMFYEY